MTRLIVRLGIILWVGFAALMLALKAGARESSHHLLAFYAVPGATSSSPVYVVVRDRDMDLVLSRDAFTSGALAWSPDGTQLAFNANECGGVCIYDFLSGRKFTLADMGIEVNGSHLAWANDGRFAYLSAHHFDRPPDIIIADASGILATFRPEIRPLSTSLLWSPDGRYLVYYEDDGASVYPNLILLDTSTGHVTNVTANDDMPQFPVWSPHGELFYTVTPYTSTPYIAAYNPTAGGARRIFEADRISTDYPAFFDDDTLHIMAWRETSTGLEIRDRTANRLILLPWTSAIVLGVPQWRADGQEIALMAYVGQQAFMTYMVNTATGTFYELRYRTMPTFNPTWSP